MKFHLRCVALIAAALLWSASTASAGKYTCRVTLSSTAINARIRWYKMAFMGGNEYVGQSMMTATNMIVNTTISPAPVVVYTGHVGTFDSPDFLTVTTIQYEDPLNTFKIAHGTATLAP